MSALLVPSPLKRRTARYSGLIGLFAVLATEIKADNTPNPFFKGGKLDAYYDRQDNGNFQVNSMLWAPGVKGGYGVLVPEKVGQNVNYYGGFVRPFLTRPDLGDLILGAQEITQGDGNQTEVQGEYRLPSGFGFGGGFVDRKASNDDIHFAKISYRNRWQDINYIFSGQWQNVQNRSYPGGYVALYDKTLMATWGSDGEQWRSTFGYVSPDTGDRIRPALEVFYVDNSIGQINGSKDLMVTGSLGFRKGFLGHAARLGRAMGPTGVEFDNPIGYLNPKFNRQLTVWEVGELLNFRYTQKTLANGVKSEVIEMTVYPTQWLTERTPLDAFFVGVGNTRQNPGQGGISGLFGYHRSFGNLESSARVQHDFDRDETSLFFGLIHWL